MSVRGVVVAVMVLNWAVAAAKLAVGYSIASLSLVADGYHSVVDGLSNVVGLIAITVSMAPPDEGHPYGHRKFETIASLMGAFLILLTAVEILRDAAGEGIGKASGLPQASPWAFTTVIATFFVNLCVATWEQHKGRELKSQFLEVDAHHTYSDVLVTSGVFVSLLATRSGYPGVDRVIGAGIGVFIGYIGLNLLSRPIQVLSDGQAVPVEEVEAVVLTVPGVISCHKVRSRGPSDQFFFMELHIQVDANISVKDGHTISHVVKDRLKEKWPAMSDAVIHVEPAEHHGAAPGGADHCH